MFEKTKTHLKENKKVYLVGAGCLTVGTAIGSAIVFHRMGGIPLEISQTAKNTALIVWKPETTQVALIKKCCPDPIPVLDKVTGESYRSIRRAMEMTGVTQNEIAKDLHGVAQRFERLPDSVFA